MRAAQSLLLVFILVGIDACSPTSKPSSSASDEVYTVAEGSVGFDITSMSNSGPFVCGYTSHGKTAKFRIELDPAKVSEKDPHISYGTGRLVSEPGS